MKIKSAIYGFVIGDAMGVPIEFEDREKLMKSPVTNMLGYGSYDVPKGVWSDDTSMTLATMDSIIVNKNKLNYNDIADKFCEWINNAKYTATNEVFDIGTTTKYSLMRYWNNKIDATKCGGNAISENGNGSLMRMLPIAFYCFYNKTEDNDIINIVRNTSSITHAHEISIIGCYMYVKYIIFILSNNNKTESYKLLQKIDYSIFNKDNINLSEINIKENNFNIEMLSKIVESKTAIEKSSIQTEGRKYSEYQKTRYQEIKRFYNLKQQLEYLDKYNIKSFDDIEKQIEFKRSEIKSKNITLKKNKKKYDAILERTEKAQDYIRLYKVYEYARSYQEQDPKYVMPKEVEIFLDLQNELQINSLDEARSLIKSTRQERIDINKTKKEILDLQRELNHLDTIKEEKLIQSGLFIYNIKFGGNHIDYKKSKDDIYCIILPYTKERIYIPKKYTTFNEKYQYYTLFLVDDKKYELYDENDNKIQSITGKDLEEHVMEKKKEIDKLYSY